MEGLFAAVSAVLIWLLTLTILLPITITLKMSKTFRNNFFSFIYVRIIQGIYESRMTEFRKKGFRLLKEELRDDCNKPLKVLEIGIGPGSNLPLYPENTHLTALDVNRSFEAYFKQNQRKFPHVTYDKTIISMAENMREVGDSEFDVVVSTLVLCSVQSVRSCIKEVHRVLKPGGLYLFVEHSGYPEGTWKQKCQKFVNPIWKLYGNGCDITRNHMKDISAEFSNVKYYIQYLPVYFFFARPWLYGVAEKS